MIVMLLAGAMLAACATQEAAPPARAVPAAGPVVVQGAMDVEVRTLAAALDNVTEEKVGGWTFWSGTLDGYPVVVSKTLKGMSNTAAATALAAERYHPAAIINQGTAGGHDPGLHVLDIVAWLTGRQHRRVQDGGAGARRGEQFRGLAAHGLDAFGRQRRSGSECAARCAASPATRDCWRRRRSVRDTYTKGRVAEGVIGSSEIWNSELDRIQRFHDQFGTSAEEMEAASAAQIAGLFRIPFLGIRVLSNNITNGGVYDPQTGVACQEYIYRVVKAYIEKLKR